MIEDFEIISCAPIELYAGGGFYDSDIQYEGLVNASSKHAGYIEALGEVFPAHTVQHFLPAITLSPDPGFAQSIDSFYSALDAKYARLSASLLVRVPQAIIWNNMIFALINDRAVPIYELYRSNDRTEKGKNLLSRLSACSKREYIDLRGENALFIGSAGSFNYGHWLVDDFPALAAGRHLKANGKPLTVLMSSFYEDVDRTRCEGTALALGEQANYRVTMLQRDTAYRVDDLHYVTPATYHAHLKNPHAIRYIRDACAQTLFDEPSCAASGKLFVNRGEGLPRRLLNNDAVVERLTALGFEEIYPDRLSLREQWATFSNAKQVVGIMGAAMTSSLLCPIGTAVTYLAPMGWIEPFYWDLAAMSDHRYSAIFGATDKSSADTYRKNFSIDIACLSEHVERIGAPEPFTPTSGLDPA